MGKANAQMKACETKIECVDPDKVEKIEVTCEVPEELEPLLKEMLNSDMIEIFHDVSKTEIDGGIDITPFRQWETLQILFSSEGDQENKLIPNNYLSWWYGVISDDEKNTKYADIKYMEGKEAMEKELKYLSNLKLTESEQNEAKDRALELLEGLISLKKYPALYEELYKDNPEIQDYIDNKITKIKDKARLWEAYIDDKSQTGEWWIQGGVIQGKWRGERIELDEGAPTDPGYDRSDQSESPETPLELKYEDLPLPYYERGWGRRIHHPRTQDIVTINISKEVHKLIKEKPEPVIEFEPVKILFKHSLPKGKNDSPNQALEDESELEKFAENLKKIVERASPPVTVILRGYTDLSGAPNYNNQRLSEDRAEWVKKRLEENEDLEENLPSIETQGCGQRYANKEQRIHKESRVVLATVIQENE